MHMQFAKIYILSAFIVIIGCKKENDSATTATTGPIDDCTIQLAPVTGSVINGRYIIALKDVVNTRTMSAIDLAKYSTSILERNNIRSASLLQSFGGHPAGFIANLDGDEVSRLGTDDGVATVE